MTFKRWDVIAVPFPYVEGYETKRRPALVVSTEAFHQQQRACYGAMITTARNMSEVQDGDIEIRDLDRAGLSSPCVVRPARLTTFEVDIGIRRVGSLGSGERRAVSALLKRWLGN